MAPAPLPGQGVPLDFFRPRDKEPERPLGRLLIIGYSVCGMIATLTPLLLWMACIFPTESSLLRLTLKDMKFQY